MIEIDDEEIVILEELVFNQETSDEIKNEIVRALVKGEMYNDDIQVKMVEWTSKKQLNPHSSREILATLHFDKFAPSSIRNAGNVPKRTDSKTLSLDFEESPRGKKAEKRSYNKRVPALIELDDDCFIPEFPTVIVRKKAHLKGKNLGDSHTVRGKAIQDIHGFLFGEQRVWEEVRMFLMAKSIPIEIGMEILNEFFSGAFQRYGWIGKYEMSADDDVLLRIEPTPDWDGLTTP